MCWINIHFLLKSQMHCLNCTVSLLKNADCLWSSCCSLTVKQKIGIHVSCFFQGLHAIQWIIPARRFVSLWNIKFHQETNGWLLILQIASVGLAGFQSLYDEWRIFFIGMSYMWSLSWNFCEQKWVYRGVVSIMFLMETLNFNMPTKYFSFW